jgi:hypothetical protein
MGRVRSGIELAYHDWSLDELVETFDAMGKPRACVRRSAQTCGQLDRGSCSDVRAGAAV